MATQTINISLPEDLLSQVDKAVKSEYTNRSEYIRQAVAGKLKTQLNNEQDWMVLEAMMADADSAASEQGYITDDDFVGAVKEVRKEYTSRSEIG